MCSTTVVRLPVQHLENGRWCKSAWNLTSQKHTNTHAFHNTHLIREVLPKHLTVPVPYALDRKAHHDQIAVGLRQTQDEKRAKNAQKAAERKKRKRADNGTAGGVEKHAAGDDSNNNMALD